MDERRRHPRYDCSFNVNYATQGVASVESRVVAEDISRLGIRIPVSRIVKKGNLLRLDIYAPDQKRAVFATGIVRWTKLDTENPKFSVDAGVEFLDIEPSDIEKLLATVQ